MYELKKSIGKLLVLPALLSLALVSCDHDHDEDDIDHHPPAFYIAMSEKISIPDAGLLLIRCQTLSPAAPG